MIVPRRNDIFVDTAGWGNFLDANEPHHSAVDLIIRQANKKRRRLVTTNYILTELVALMHSNLHFHRNRLIRAMNELVTAPNVDVLFVNETQQHAAWAMLEKYADKEWSLIDASSFVIMQQYGITEALTTDHHFTQAGFVRLPAEPV